MHVCAVICMYMRVHIYVVWVGAGIGAFLLMAFMHTYDECVCYVHTISYVHTRGMAARQYPIIFTHALISQSPTPLQRPIERIHLRGVHDGRLFGRIHIQQRGVIVEKSAGKFLSQNISDRAIERSIGDQALGWVSG